VGKTGRSNARLSRAFRSAGAIRSGRITILPRDPLRRTAPIPTNRYALGTRVTHLPPPLRQTVTDDSPGLATVVRRGADNREMPPGASRGTIRLADHGQREFIRVSRVAAPSRPT